MAQIRAVRLDIVQDIVRELARRRRRVLSRSAKRSFTHPWRGEYQAREPVACEILRFYPTKQPMTRMSRVTSIMRDGCLEIIGMSEAVAKKGDRVVGLDTHVVLVKEQGGAPTPMQFPFSGPIQSAVSDSVFVDNAAAATVGSVADNLPAHLPLGGPFKSPPVNKATVSAGSGTVFIGNAGIARSTDAASCCNDPADADTGHVVATGTVYAG